MEMNQSMTNSISHSQNEHLLYDNWVFWAHLPHDTDWSLTSYKKICELKSVENVLSLIDVVPEKMIQNCMLFFMRKHINPTWEDPLNKNGGCFSFKIPNKNIYRIWNQMICALMGETISNDEKFLKCVNGITLSPKKSFCILKVWMSNVNNQNPKKICEIAGLTVHGCLFKKHNPNPDRKY